MTIVYDVGEEDVADLNLFSVQSLPAMRNAVLKKQLGMSASAAAIVLAMDWASGTGISGVGFGIALALAVGLFVLNRGLHPRRIRAAVAKSARTGELKGVLGVHHLTLADDGVLERSSIGDGKLSWDAIQSVMATTGPVYIFLVDGKALIIPRRAFTSEAEKTAFMDAAERYYSAAKGGTAAAK
jgi:hypothetical protein